MQEFIDSIMASVSGSSLWTTVAPIGALVAVLVLFKLGFRTTKDQINNATSTKGKAIK